MYLRPGIYVTSSACLPLPSLFVRYAHLTVMISLSRERGLLWFRHKPLQSLTLRFGTNSFLLRDPLYQQLLVSQVPLFVLSRLLSSFWVSRTGSASDWCALQEALYKFIDTIQCNLTWRASCFLRVVSGSSNRDHLCSQVNHWWNEAPFSKDLNCGQELPRRSNSSSFVEAARLVAVYHSGILGN